MIILKKKEKKTTLKELKTKHTETSIEGLETKITTLTLLYDKHSEKINDFIEIATINKTNFLKVYLEAIINNNSKLIENKKNKNL